MKEATGELNTTVLVVIIVGLLSAFFFTVIWPMINDNYEHNASCAKAICDNDVDNDNMVTCYIKGQNNKTFKCPFTG